MARATDAEVAAMHQTIDPSYGPPRIEVSNVAVLFAPSEIDSRQVVYVDVRCGSDLFRTTAQAKKFDPLAPQDQPLAFDTDRGSLTVPTPLKPDTVLQFSVRRCQIFGDADVFAIDVPVAALPVVKETRTHFKAGRFVFHLLPINLGHPPTAATTTSSAEPQTPTTFQEYSYDRKKVGVGEGARRVGRSGGNAAAAGGGGGGAAGYQQGATTGGGRFAGPPGGDFAMPAPPPPEAGAARAGGSDSHPPPLSSPVHNNNNSGGAARNMPMSDAFASDAQQHTAAVAPQPSAATPPKASTGTAGGALGKQEGPSAASPGDSNARLTAANDRHLANEEEDTAEPAEPELVSAARSMPTIFLEGLEIYKNEEALKPLHYRGALPVENPPSLPVHYRRSLRLRGLLQPQQQSAASPSRPSGIASLFGAVTTALANTVTDVASVVDVEMMRGHFPDIRSPLVHAYSPHVLNGHGTPIEGRLYITTKEVAFQGPLLRFHVTFADIPYMRRCTSFGRDCIQLFCPQQEVYQLQDFDGMVARLGAAVGLREQSKFWEAFAVLTDLWRHTHGLPDHTTAA